MFRKFTIRSFALQHSVALLLALLILSGCALAPRPVTAVDAPAKPTPFSDPQAFRRALMLALSARDMTQLQAWMTSPVLNGVWRGEMWEIFPAEAAGLLKDGKMLPSEQSPQRNKLALVNDVDLKALLGGKDPLSIPRAGAHVVDAFLVSGWGAEGTDEAILYLAAQPDGSLKWYGWIQINGGFSGARLGGSYPYHNEPYGISMYLPKDYTVEMVTPEQISILGPHENNEPGMAFIYMEPANGRTSQQAAESAVAENKAILGPNMPLGIASVLDIEGSKAYVGVHFPGQDLNTQLFIVHNDSLYRIMFTPDTPASGEAYLQMQNIYNMLTNTLHFTR